MSQFDKLLAKILWGAADHNIPFRSLVRLLRQLGFQERIEGSHHIFTREGIPEMVTLQPLGSKAKSYQVKQVRNLIIKHKLGGVQDAEI